MFDNLLAWFYDIFDSGEDVVLHPRKKRDSTVVSDDIKENIMLVKTLTYPEISIREFTLIANKQFNLNKSVSWYGRILREANNA